MFDVVKSIAREISRDIGADYQDFDAIDEALRTRRPLMLYQKPYDLERFARIANQIAEEAVASMLGEVGSTASFQNIVLVGGGAELFRKAVKRAFPRQPDRRREGAGLRERARIPDRRRALRGEDGAEAGRTDGAGGRRRDGVSGEPLSLVVTYTLNRDEDPLLFDHLVAFKKGRHRRARLGKLISMGFEHEKSELRARDRQAPADLCGKLEGGARLDLLDDLLGDGSSGGGGS